MIVDDDPMVSFLHKKILQKNKIVQEPLAFLNGKEAWDFLINDKTETNYLILLDLNMPVLTGWQLLDKLVENECISNRTKVVIVTSSINLADINKAKNYSLVEQYLIKPLLDLSEILEIWEKLKK